MKQARLIKSPLTGFWIIQNGVFIETNRKTLKAAKNIAEKLGYKITITAK